jgi:hypothetical protein
MHHDHNSDSKSKKEKVYRDTYSKRLAVVYVAFKKLEKFHECKPYLVEVNCWVVG